MSAGTAASEQLEAYLADAELEWERGTRPGEYVVTLPGERKLRTVVSVLVRDQSTKVIAFVIRNPDENHERVYRWLLRRNLGLPGLAYAIDDDGDVYVRGQLPSAAVTPDTLDALFGAVLIASDGAFNDLLALGFLGSMRKEWAWRLSRGESTANLEAFRHLLE